MSTIDDFEAALNRATRLLRSAREELEWLCRWESVPMPLLFLGRVGAAVILGEARVALRSGGAEGPWKKELCQMQAMLCRLRSLVSKAVQDQASG